MATEYRPSNPRCPRCDEELSVNPIGRGPGRGLMLACPEPYCDYVWAPTRGELARMARGQEAGLDPDGYTRAAG
jgi:hypothetical protein